MYIVVFLTPVILTGGVLWLLACFAPAWVVGSVGGLLIVPCVALLVFGVAFQIGGSRRMSPRAMLLTRLVAFSAQGSWVGLWMGPGAYLFAGMMAALAVLVNSAGETMANRRAIATGHVPVMDDGTLVAWTTFNLRRWVLYLLASALASAVMAWAAGTCLGTRIEGS